MSDAIDPPAAVLAHESYIVHEGKKRGSTRGDLDKENETTGRLE